MGPSDASRPKTGRRSAGHGRVRRRLATGLASLAALGLGLVQPRPAAATAYTPAVAPDTLGVNMQWTFHAGEWGRLGWAPWGAWIRAAHQWGIDVVREDAQWDLAEPNPPDPTTGQHTYTWSNPGFEWALDYWVRDLARSGIRWQPIIDYSASWASSVPGDIDYPPASDAEFAGYARAVAHRYGRNGYFWKGNPSLPYRPVTTYEIWNEENLQSFWKSGCDPTAYGHLFVAAATQIHQIDPYATVVVGGLADGGYNSASCTAADFATSLEQNTPGVYAAAGGVALHPYGPYIPDVESAVTAFRQTLDQQVGVPNIPLYLTEYGWPSSAYAGGGLPETSLTGAPNRADAITTTARDLSLSNCLVRNVMIHTWDSPEADHNNPQDWYGIADRHLDPLTGQLSLHGSGQAYGNLVIDLEGRGSSPPPYGVVNLCPWR